MKKLINWKEMLKLWEESTQSKKQFCEQNNIPYTSFSRKTSRLPKISFVPITVKPDTTSAPKLRNGSWTFEFPLNATPEYIARLLRAMGGTDA